MRLTVFAAAMLLATPCFAMGGGGYGGGMQPNTPYGGMRNTGGSADYASALRLIRDSRYADAIPYLEKALRAKPSNADVLNYLGFTQRMVGNYQVSLDYYQRALAINPDHRGAREYLGELYLNLNQLTNAKAQLAELTRLCPSSCDEKEVLTKSIAVYEAKAAAPPAAASSAAPTPPAVQPAPGASAAAPSQSAPSSVPAGGTR